jgi:hypothetical protein
VSEQKDLVELDECAEQAAAGAEIQAQNDRKHRRKHKQRRARKIALHAIIKSQLVQLDLLELESEDDFHALLDSTIEDMDARTQSEQQMALRRAHQIFKDLRADRLAVTLVEREMRAAARVVFARLIDPEGIGGPQVAAKARACAEDARYQTGYDDVELSGAGLGEYSIETEAAVRALQNLAHLEKIRSANQREKINTLKEFDLWRRITKKGKEWPPKSRSPQIGVTPRKAQARGPNRARRARK